jgi:hypothetical protein
MLNVVAGWNGDTGVFPFPASAFWFSGGRSSLRVHISRFVQPVLGCFSIAGHLFSPAAMLLPHRKHVPSSSCWGDWLFQNTQAVINRMLEGVSVAVSGASNSMG